MDDKQDFFGLNIRPRHMLVEMFGDPPDFNILDAPRMDEDQVREVKAEIERIVGILTYRECAIIVLRFGVSNNVKYTLKEVGRIFKITRERVRQIQAEARRKLNHPIIRRKLEIIAKAS